MTQQIKKALTGHKGERLKGKVALVTGIGSGIGKGIALLYAQQGAKVIGCDIDPISAESTLQEAAREGLQINSLHPIDLTREADVSKIVEHAVKSAGQIDILVNAAAFGAFKWLEEMDYESEWRRTLTGEVDVVFLACKAAWPHLKQSCGSVINFASANAHMALPKSPALAHCAGKGAVLAMSRQLAMEGSEYGIRVNTISPGLVETTATRIPLEQIDGFKEQVMSKLMLKRVGQPSDIGWLAVYLGSDESSWVTASDFCIDGGASAW